MFEFIETPFFTKAVDRCLDDDEYCELQKYLNEHPESGKVVSGSEVYGNSDGMPQDAESVVAYESSTTYG